MRFILSMLSFDHFETELITSGDLLLVLARREGTDSETRLYMSRDGGTTLETVPAPPRIHALAASGEIWIATTSDTLYTTRDDGQTWTASTLPLSEMWSVLCFVGSEAWLASGNQILVCVDGTARVAWKLSGANEHIAEIIPIAGGSVLVTTDRGRILRGEPGSHELEDWSKGLPALTVGFGSPTIGRMEGIWLAFQGDLFARRDGDPTWIPLPPSTPPDGGYLDAIRWLAPTQSAQWVAAPWGCDTWIGTDGAGVLMGGPRSMLRWLWQPSDGRMSIKHLAPGGDAVFVSLRNATMNTAGVAVRANTTSVVKISR